MGFIGHHNPSVRISPNNENNPSTAIAEGFSCLWLDSLVWDRSQSFRALSWITANFSSQMDEIDR